MKGADAARSTVLDTRRALAPQKLRRTDRLAAWAAGEAVLSEARTNDPRASALSSKGIAFGADMRLSRRLLIGNAVGLAYDRSPLSTDLTYAAGSLSNTFYGTFFATPDTYLDAALGGAQSGFAGWADGGSGLANAAGSQVYAMLRASRRLDLDLHLGRVTLRGYSQGTVARMRFTGAAPDRQARRAEIALGLGGETQLSTRRGRLTPRAGLEWRIARVRRTTPDPDVDPERPEAEATRSISQSARIAATAGFDWALNPRATVKADYGLSAGTETFAPKQTVKARFTLRF